MFIMALDNDGEGGVFALSALVPNWKWGKTFASRSKYLIKTGSTIVSIICASFVLGDSVITPPISVLSALEGIETEAPSFASIVVPLAVIILVLLFLAQRFGTAKVGYLFGPIMLLWAAVIGALGIYNITLNPRSLLAFNPAYGYFFFQKNGATGFKMFGGVVLCLTGVEAMYADMGHFGKLPIRLSWLFVVFPSVILSYLGQSAAMLNDPSNWNSPFFKSLPQPIYWPVLVLATFATIIASQAMITGAFSLISQAVALGYFPRVKIVHTSKSHEGQIFIPMINIFLLIMCVILVIAFQTSAALASAFGLAVCGVLILTTLIYIVVVVINWKCNIFIRIAYLVPFTILFMPIQAFFFAANASKFVTGGWLPFLIGLFFTVIMLIWTWGSATLKRINKDDVVLTFDEFHKQNSSLKRIHGVGVFFVSSSTGVPRYLTKFTKTLTVLPEIVAFVNIKYYRVPFVTEKHRFSVYQINENTFRIVARYGFFEKKVALPEVIAQATKRFNYTIPDASPTTIGVVQHKDVEITLPESVESDTSNDTGNAAPTPASDAVSPESQKTPSENKIKALWQRFWQYLTGAEEEVDPNANKDIHYFLPRDTVMVNKKRWFFTRYPAQVFVFMLRNSRDETKRLQISPERVFEVGNVVHL
jgi:KUP system potassium uptake protein